MNFIRNHIEKKIIKDTKSILKHNYLLVLNEKVMAGYKYSWEVIGVSSLGLPTSSREIALDWSLIKPKELLSIFNQIQSGQYTIQKYRSKW